MRSHLTLFLIAPLAATPLAAQAASSDTYFAVSQAQASGGNAQSTTYKLTGALGPGVTAERVTSATFVLEAGFTGSLGVSVTGRPWLTGVTPPRAGLNGGTPATLHGTELDLGLVSTVTIGGVPATVGTRTHAKITTVVPPQPAPGPQPVQVSSAFGSSTLPRGLGVLPLLEWEVLPQTGVSSVLRYRGTTGDLALLVFSLGLGQPFVLTGYGYSLQLEAGLIVAGPVVVPVLSPDGAVSIRFPAFPVPIGIQIQGLGLSANPTYAPGAFTNVVQI